MLAGQNQDYLVKALHAYAATERENSTMHAMASPLSELNIGQITAYFASQEPKSVVYMQLPCTEGSAE
jgi:cytochrome c553